LKIETKREQNTMRISFNNVNLIDGTGNGIQKNVCIVVEDGIVKKICDNSDGVIGNVSDAVDLTGRYIMPGLIDCHVHIVSDASADPALALQRFSQIDFTMIAVKNLATLLKSGVTYIREVGDVHNIALGLKKYVQDGSIKGPGMHCANRIITMTGGHGHMIGREADGVDGVRKAVREQLKAGADLIKVVSTGGVMTPGVDVNAYQFNTDELKAAADEAHKAGRKICAHCHGTQGVKNSVIAGIDSIEHATILDEEAVDMMAAGGTYMVPTLVATYYIIENGEAAGIPAFAVDKAKEVAQKHIKSLEMAYRAGVPIAMGTDAGTPFNRHGISSAVELELMVRAGMEAMDVIQTSTKSAAELIGIQSKYGTLELGKFADFMVLSENPLTNIKTVQCPRAVYKRGERV